jgi:tetratricopeptide (TPR) repeat protein
MSLDEWLEEPGNEQLLSEHNEVLERAKIHEGNRPEKGSRRRLLRRLESEQKRHEYRTRRKKTEVLFTPPMYPPCTISIYDLKKTMIKDLRCEIRSLNSYILARTVNPAVKMDAVVALVEDEEGNVVLMRILHEWLLYHGSRLDENMVLLVKQPCLQWISDKEYEIKIDHVSDVVIIPLFDGRVPLSWRDESLNDISEWSYDNWAKIGDEASKKGEHRFAVEWYGTRRHYRRRKRSDHDRYTKALECSPPADIAALLLFSRSDGYFQTHQYETALRDLEKATGCPEISEHLLRRKAQVLYHLQQYQECCEAYNELLNNHPGRQSDNDRLNDAIARLAEQQHGSYNFKKMQDNAIHSRTLLLDHATYQGPVVLGESKMHGRGLFTTKAVKAGDLLLCEKAFSYTFSAKDTSSTIQVNPETKFVARGSTIDLTTATITKLQAYPSKIPQLTALHRGTFPEAITIDKANNPLIDT